MKLKRDELKIYYTGAIDSELDEAPGTLLESFGYR